MERFGHVLVVVDDVQVTRKVIRRVARLADHVGAKLTLLGLVDRLPRFRRYAHVGHEIIDLQERLIEARREQLRSAARLASEEVEPVTIIAAAGHHVTDVLEVAARENADLIVLPRGASDGSPEHELGTSGRQLLRESPVPVLVARPTTARGVRVLAAVDPDPDDRERDSLNLAVLDLAAAWARWEDADLHIVHAWEFPEESTLRSSVFLRIGPGEVDAMVDTIEARREELVDSLVLDAPLGNVRYDVHVVRGDAAECIAQHADELNSTLIVMGTVGRHGVRAFALGNTAERVLGRVSCSVLTVHPPRVHDRTIDLVEGDEELSSTSAWG